MMTRLSRFLALLAVLLVAAFAASNGWAAPAGPEDGHAQTEQAAADGHEAAGGHGGGGDHGPPAVIPPAKEGLGAAITSLLVFALVFFILYVKVWPIITKGLDERASKIREEIAAAEAARKQAKDALDEYERSLSQARAESQQMLEETKSQQAELAAQLRAKADQELNAMRDRAKRDIEAAKRTALNEIYTESVGLASTMASKILQREISVTDQQNLVNESLAEMKAKSN
jgi:F-type H+-transporting ATPase subunit b